MKCDACKETAKQLLMDFDREGNVRGKLCQRCLDILKLVGDDPVKLSRLADVLERTQPKGRNCLAKRRS